MTGIMVMQLEMQLSGDSGGNGVSRFHIGLSSGATPGQPDVDQACSHVLAFYGGLQNHYPSGYVLQLSEIVKIIDTDSGEMQKLMSPSTTNPQFTGTGAGGGHVAGMGARVNWYTASVLNGRLVRGATFMSPLDSLAYASNGNVTGTTISAILSAAQTFISSAASGGQQLLVYHRPPKKTTTGGIAFPVVSATIPNAACSLRSRRV